MLELRERCEDDDRRACVRLGIIIGENRERRTVQNVDVTYSKGETMYRALGAALLTIAIAAPIQDAAAQDPVGGAILGGAAGAILGGALDGGRGAAIGAIVGGATGAAIAAQGQPRPGGYRY